MLKGCPATPTLPYIAHTKRKKKHKTFFAEKERCVCSSFLSIVLQHTFPQLSGKVFLCCLKVHITSVSKKRLHICYGNFDENIDLSRIDLAVTINQNVNFDQQESSILKFS